MLQFLKDSKLYCNVAKVLLVVYGLALVISPNKAFGPKGFAAQGGASFLVFWKSELTPPAEYGALLAGISAFLLGAGPYLGMRSEVFLKQAILGYFLIAGVTLTGWLHVPGCLFLGDHANPTAFQVATAQFLVLGLWGAYVYLAPGKYVWYIRKAGSPKSSKGSRARSSSPKKSKSR